MADPLAQYLDAYAEREVGAAANLEGPWESALVVPAYRESIELLDGLRDALGAATSLLVLVVNRPAGDEPVAAPNRTLLEAARGLGEATPLADGVELIRTGDFDLVLIDRSTGTRAFGDKDGVGLARRIGLDLCCALWRNGSLASDWLFTTDADATLPRDYFSAAKGAPRDAVAMTLPYEHITAGESREVAEAISLYEISLRYYLLGLRAAGSPYAFSSIGSTIAVRASAYAEVRGMPKRLAGEDFYLLAKLAKLGAIHRPSLSPIRLEGARDIRTPFGTAKGVAAIVANRSAFALYNPESFRLLSEWLAALDEAAQLGNAAPTTEVATREPLASSLASLRVAGAIERALSQGKTAGERRRRLHDVFDAKLTLRLIHNLRDVAHPDLPWREALERAAFISGCDGAAGPLVWKAHLVDVENDGPASVGVASGVDSGTDQD